MLRFLETNHNYGATAPRGDVEIIPMSLRGGEVEGNCKRRLPEGLTIRSTRDLHFPRIRVSGEDNSKNGREQMEADDSTDVRGSYTTVL